MATANEIKRNQIWSTVDSSGYFDVNVRVVREARNGLVRCKQQSIHGKGDIYEFIEIPVDEFDKEIK